MLVACLCRCPNPVARADAMSMFLDPPGVPDHPLFQNVDLSHLKRFGQDLRNYLLMHAAFKKLIDARLHHKTCIREHHARSKHPGGRP